MQVFVVLVNVYVRFIKSVGMVIVVIKLETHITVIMVVQITESKTLIKLFVIEYLEPIEWK